MTKMGIYNKYGKGGGVAEATDFGGRGGKGGNLKDVHR